MEIPLLFPTLEDGAPRYLLAAEAGTIVRVDRSSLAAAATVASPPPPTQWTSPSLKGAASVSRLSPDTLLTTNLLEEEQWILSVSVLSASSTYTLELDLSGTTCFQGIVSAKAFHDKGGVRLLLVDRNGAILKVLFYWDSSVHVLDPYKVSLHQWATARVSIPSSRVLPCSLNHARVAFLSRSRVLLALSPFLLTIDIDKGDEIIPWSRGKALEAMQGRTLSSLLYNVVVGKSDESFVIDMEPVAALTAVVVEDIRNSKDNPSVVFTLHSNGDFRIWTVPPTGAAIPSALKEPHPKFLPDPAQWGIEDDYSAPMLAASLYDQDLQTYACALYVPENQACRLSLVHGSIADDGDHASGDLSLEVPHGSTSLISMDFDSHSEKKCSLIAWFHQKQALAGEDVSGTACVRYPPSHVSILGSKPVLFPPEGFLDRMVWKEHSRIQALQPMESVYDLPLDDAIHMLDQQFLRFLFRPVFRGITPLRAPSVTHIRNALFKTVRTPTTASQLGMRSVELEVITVLHEWREEDNRRLTLATPLKTPQRRPTNSSTPMSAWTDRARETPSAMSLYDSIGGHGDEDNNYNGEIEVAVSMDLEGDDLGQQPQDTKKEIEKHASRWRTLLMAIWEEEEALRVPFALSTSTCDKGDVAVMVRSGAISVLLPTVTVSEMTLRSVPGLRNTLFEFDRSSSEILNIIESDQALCPLLAKLEREHLELVSGVDMALSQQSVQKVKSRLLVFTDRLAARYGELFSQTDWQYDMSNSPEDALVSALEETSASMFSITLPDDYPSTIEDVSPSSKTDILGRQNRLSICGAVVRNLESAQRLLLGRCLLLVLNQIGQARPFDTSLRMYLHSMAVGWTAAQQISIPRSQSLQPLFEQAASPPPKKRPSIDGGSPTILGTVSITCVLDAHLSQLGRSLTNFGSGGRRGSSISYALLAYTTELTKTCLRLNPGSDFDSYWLPPELGILAPDPSLHPKLQLRLLAPHVVLCRHDEEPIVVAHREEKIAISLLLSAHSEAETRARLMVSRALDLLPFEPSDLEKSKNRLEKLSCHVTNSNDETVVSMFLEFVDRAITTIEELDERDRMQSNSFYVSLLSTIFHLSLNPQIQNWQKAFNSCLKNPNVQQRATYLRALAQAMVTNGALAELIKLCRLKPNDAAGSCGFEEFMTSTNMYEIAAEAMMKETGIRDINADRLRQEALYVLGAAKNDWLRSAQALDTTHTNAIFALRSDPSASELDTEMIRSRERLIVDDLRLSALGSFVAAIQADDDTSQFVISGDRAHYFTAPVRLEAESVASKRHRGLAFPLPEVGDVEEQANKLARYLSLHDLEVRSAMSSALATLFYDERTDQHLVKSTFLEGFNSPVSDSAKVVDALFSQGYYDQGLVIKRLLVSSDAPGSKLGGQNAFHEALIDLLCSFLVPMSLGKTVDFAMPSLDQLNDSLDALSSQYSGSPPILSVRRSKKLSELPRHSVCIYAMALLQACTMEYTSPSMPLAIKVAECFLSHQTLTGRTMPVPAWLEMLLIRGSETAVDCQPGKFARRPRRGQELFPGDPSALLSLYTRSGLYQDACRVVTTALSDARDEVEAPRRLPQKGNMDFVPYAKIDLLWNLIDIAIDDGSVKDKKQQEMLLESRKGMEDALEHHFRLLKISEMGQASARALPEQE